MNVRLTRRAERAVWRIHDRWQAEADHPGVFLTEMLEAVELLETVSTPGVPCPTQRHPSLKRILLEKSRCHVYFEIIPERQLIDIIAVWDGRRERAPKL